MSVKKNYSRYFIILQEEEKDNTSTVDKAASGYAKFETKNDKCRISYYVQNLKKEKEPYYLILICNKKDIKTNIKLGEMNIDEYGRAEVNFNFEADNVSSSGISMDKVIGTAVVRLAQHGIVNIMSGFICTDLPSDWTGYTLTGGETSDKTIEEKQHKEEHVYPAPEFAEERKETETYQEDVSVKNIEESDREKLNNDELKEENIFENYEKMIEEVKLSETAGPERKEETENIPVEEEFRSEDYPIGKTGSFFKHLASGFEEKESFSNEIKKCRWYKVPVKNLEDLCDTSDYDKYAVVYYPMISYFPYIHKHSYFILGYKYDTKGKMKYIIYGIPGYKKPFDQPYRGKSGFVSWIPQNQEADENSLGYWLMFYDFRRSTVVIPVK